MNPSGPNAEQIQFWNEQMGATWVAHQSMLDAQIGVYGREAMDRARLATGESVLDIGCGCGDTTMELAGRVGPRGRVTGVDISGPMLGHAQARVREAGLTNVHLELADAQTHAFLAGSFDLAFSRFGVMFFSDPVAAFTNIGLALRRGGRLAFVCWREVRENPWVLVPLMAAMPHITLTPPPPDAPGPFAFADADRVRRILDSAGFADIDCAPWDTMMTLGGVVDLDQAVALMLQVGPLARAMRESGDAARTAVAAAGREALQAHHTPEGVRLGGGAWMVSAQRR
jgi:SAM-dependent methyltransferase